FFYVALVCHGELAATRPGPRHLTEFYLWLAVGGVLGGVFNALVAPLAFTRLLEYPLVTVLACVLVPPRDPVDRQPAQRWLDLALLLGLVVLTLGVWLWDTTQGRATGLQALRPMPGVRPAWLLLLVCLALVGVAGYLLTGRADWRNRVLDVLLPAAL